MTALTISPITDADVEPVVALWHWLDARRSRRKGPLTGALLLAVAVRLQAALGILTLIHQVPIGLALAHQGTAMIVLALATLHAARLGAAGFRNKKSTELSTELDSVPSS